MAGTRVIEVPEEQRTRRSAQDVAREGTAGPQHSRERRRVEHRHDLGEHRLARREAGLVVAAERILEHAGQAPVAVRAGALGAVLTASEDPGQIRIGDERPRDADRITVAALDDCVIR
jgi:hypothetical protein